MKKERKESLTTSVVMPKELKEWLLGKAAANCRSFSGEVVSRLMEEKRNEQEYKKAA